MSQFHFSILTPHTCQVIDYSVVDLSGFFKDHTSLGERRGEREGEREGEGERERRREREN